MQKCYHLFFCSAKVPYNFSAKQLQQLILWILLDFPYFLGYKTEIFPSKTIPKI